MTSHTGVPQPSGFGHTKWTSIPSPQPYWIYWLHSAMCTHSALIDLGKPGLLSAYVNSLSATVGLHLWKDITHLYLLPSGNLSTITTSHSVCRQDLSCVYLAPEEQVWHDIHNVLHVDIYMFDTQDLHMWNTAIKDWMVHCLKHRRVWWLG